MSDLIDRQALRAAHGLGADCHDCKRDMKSCQYDRDYSLMDFCEWLDDAPAASPWHRVEEELPPKATWVMTVATDGNVKLFNIATVDAGGQWWTCSPQNILRELYGVRYWMPIEPPKEDA